MTATMQLIAIGKVPASPASAIRVGDRLMWNYGRTHTVAAVEPCGRQSVKVTEQAPDGKQYTRRFLGTRLVCILPAEPAPQFPPSLTATGVGDGLKGY